jgi:hypothetical protein
MPDKQEPLVPAPAKIDELAREYLEIEEALVKKQLALADETAPQRARLKVLGEQLLADCVAFGSPHEKKSKLLTGLLFEVMTSVSTSTSIDSAAVNVFMKACKKAKQSKLFAQIFEEVKSWRIRPEADTVTRDNKKISAALLVKLMKCTISDTKPARLAAVRPRKNASAA